MPDAGRIALFLVVCSLALLFAEMQVRREVSTRYICLGLVWVTVVGMCLWLAYGA
jgi:uncharacterized protein with PQ loop repeat